MYTGNNINSYFIDIDNSRTNNTVTTYTLHCVTLLLGTPAQLCQTIAHYLLMMS